MDLKYYVSALALYSLFIFFVSFLSFLASIPLPQTITSGFLYLFIGVLGSCMFFTT